MEKLIQAQSVFSRALLTFDEILKEQKSVIVRDAAIQRFEYTFEAGWKCLMAYLFTIEGIDCGSPKTCFRQALVTGVFTPEEVETALSMCDDRYLTSHTYLEAVAEKNFGKLSMYLKVLQKLESKIAEKLQ
jgi:nucleotidyltransferase substrate binding protein (TIGR01987 family)